MQELSVGSVSRPILDERSRGYMAVHEGEGFFCCWNECWASRSTNLILETLRSTEESCCFVCTAFPSHLTGIYGNGCWRCVLCKLWHLFPDVWERVLFPFSFPHYLSWSGFSCDRDLDEGLFFGCGVHMIVILMRICSLLLGFQIWT